MSGYANNVVEFGGFVIYLVRADGMSTIVDVEVIVAVEL